MTPKYKLVKPSRSRYWLIRLEHPSPEGWRERSTKEARRRDAERVAAKIVTGLIPAEVGRMTWAAFRSRYQADHLSTLKRPGCFKSAAAKMEAMIKPHYLDELDAARMKQWRQKMLAAGMPPTTVSSYLKHVRASLGWAEESGYIKHAPRVRSGSTAKMKGRPLTAEEFQDMLDATVKVVGRKRAGQWRRFLEGLWLIGLRLQEAVDMDWRDHASIRPVGLETDRPMVCFPMAEQKNGKDQLVPLTPEAAAFLRKTPKSKRTGPVFPISGARKPITTADRAGRYISRIGEEAGIMTSVDPSTGKKIHATAHDLRRSFAMRLIERNVPADILQVLMRHADIKTTNTHYAQMQAEQVAVNLSAYYGIPQT
jgi:integrase